MKVPIHIAKKLLQLAQGEIISSSIAKHAVIEELVSEGIIERKGRVQKTLQCTDSRTLLLYLQTKYDIPDLDEYIKVFQKESVYRHELVAASSDSKLKKVRTFKGFLITSYMPIEAKFNHKMITFNFMEGIFQFIYDFENFIPDKNITIVGVENAENFRFIEKQRHLFKEIQPLFVSRYPQNQHKDLIKWLQKIPNNYLHFGDFDIAGVGIYINEYKKYLAEKARFFVPKDIDDMIRHGSRERYDRQKINFNITLIEEPELIKLIAIIHKHKKGLDQEIFINEALID